MKNLTLLLLITVGVFVGTLAALYVAAKVGEQQLQTTEASNPLLGILGNL